MKAASDTTFTVADVVRLQVEIGEHVTNAVFRVAPKLATKRISRTAFINKMIKILETKIEESCRKIVMLSQLSIVLRTKTLYNR